MPDKDFIYNIICASLASSESKNVKINITIEYCVYLCEVLLVQPKLREEVSCSVTQINDVIQINV